MTTITYGDPAYPNFTKWVDSLAITDLPQATGKLVEVNGEDGTVVGYCCLGQGCTLLGVTPIIIHDDDEESPEGWYREYGEFFGRSDLAPSEFLKWLGLDSDCDEHDIIVNAPRYLGRQGRQRYTLDGEPAHIEGASRREATSCAGMNDAFGLTFPQISDVLRYFGITDIEPD